MSTTEVWLNVDRTLSFAEGASFGAAGPYERIMGKARFALDPADPRLPRIVDLELAPLNATRRVEFEADFELLKPVDPSRGSGRLLYEASNRGGKAALRMF